MRWGHQDIQQRNDVLHLGRIGQVGFFGLLAGNAERLQFGLHQRQPRTLSRQDHDFFGLFTRLQ